MRTFFESPLLNTARTWNGATIRLTVERWLHIAQRHPELNGMRLRLLETLMEPDLVQRGDASELLAVRHYAQTPLGSKYLVLVYSETSPEVGFVVTAYLTRRLSARRFVIWKR